jgi:hypothetical protein
MKIKLKAGEHLRIEHDSAFGHFAVSVEGGELHVRATDPADAHDGGAVFVNDRTVKTHDLTPGVAHGRLQ